MTEGAFTMQLLKRIDISQCGKGCRMRLGDLNGDGRLEIVMLQPDSGFDNRYFPHSVICATVFNLEGEMLWQTGTPDLESDCDTFCDIPAQVYDIDNDGNNELLIVSNGEFLVLDGMTGALKKSYPLPDPYAHDCIIIADLEGRGYAQNIILKNRFHQLWAMDVNFNVMWTYKGNIGHFPWPYDINGDGRDELIAGYTILNGEGDVIGNIDGESGHVNYIWVGDLYQSGESGISIAVQGSKTTLLTLDGSLIGQIDDGTVYIAPGNLCPGVSGTEIGCSGRNISLYSCHGDKLSETVSHGGTLTAVHNLDASGTDMLLSYGSGMPASLFDSSLNQIFTFPYDGQVLWADLIGDNIPEILLLSGDKLEIYSAFAKDLTAAAVPYTRPQPKRLYNCTRHANEMEPSQYALSYITGHFESSNLRKWAAEYAFSSDIYGNEPISRADFIVLLVNALGLCAYERDNFSDVYPKDYYAKAVGIAKKLGIVEGTLGRFNPRAAITAEAAVEIIKKAGHDCFLMTDGDLTLRSAAKIVFELLER